MLERVSNNDIVIKQAVRRNFGNYQAGYFAPKNSVVLIEIYN